MDSIAVAPPVIISSTVVNPRDHGALITITAALCLTASWIVYCMRLVIRWPWARLYGKDDLSALVAGLLGLAQVAVVLSAITVGLGKTTDDLERDTVVAIEKMLYASNILYVIAVFTSKFTLAFMFRRLSDSRHHQTCSHIIGGMTAVFCVASVLAIGIPVSTSMPWTTGPATAEGTLGRWIAIEIMSTLVDIAIVCFPVYLIWDLHMSRSKKMRVFLGFATRLPLVPLTILRVISLSFSLRRDDWTLEYVTSEIFTQIVMCYSLVAATIPCLRIFMQAANTGLIGGTLLDASRRGSYATKLSGNHTDVTTSGRSGSHGSRNLRAMMTHRSRRGEDRDISPIELYPQEHGETRASIISASERHPVGDETSQTAIMVRQTVRVEVESSIGPYHAK